MTYIKYLGVLIDQNFTWKEHISYVTTKIRKLIYKFYELRHVLSLSTLKMVYYALVETVLNYGLVVWGSAGVTILNKLQVAQKYIIKIIQFKNKRFSTELLFKESQLLDIRQLHIKAVVRFMIKCSYYKECISQGRNTRNAV